MLLHSLLSAYTGVIENADGDVESYLYPDVWTSYAKDGLSSVFLWCAVALAALLLVVGVLVKWKRTEIFKSYLTVAVAIAVGFSVAVIATMLSLEFMEMAEKEYLFDLVLYPSVVLGGCVVAGAVAVFVCYLFGEKPFRIAKLAALSAVGAALVAFLVCLGVYLGSGEGESNNGVTITVSENILLYVCAALLVALLLFIAFFFGRKDKKGFDTRSISYAAVCIAISFALSYIAPIHMPQGGSVTIASLLPLMIYSYMFGVKKGIFAGLIYGILQAVQDPWIIHPAQFLLDYPIAFAGIGAAGLFAKVKKLENLPQVQFALGAIVAGTLRYLAHILSGVFAFSEFAYHWTTGDPMNAWLYSLGYNSFVFIDLAIAIAVGILVFSSKSFVKQARKFNTEKTLPAQTPAVESAPADEPEEK